MKDVIIGFGGMPDFCMKGVKTGICILLLLMGSLSLGCQKAVPLDPRDEAIAEEMTRISRELNVHVRSDYWGQVKVSFVTRAGGKVRIGNFNNSSKYRTKVISKGVLGNGMISVLIEPFAQTPYAPIVTAQDVPPWGAYIFLLEGIMINSMTADLWIDIANQPSLSAATWR